MIWLLPIFSTTSVLSSPQLITHSCKDSSIVLEYAITSLLQGVCASSQFFLPATVSFGIFAWKTFICPSVLSRNATRSLMPFLAIQRKVLKQVFPILFVCHFSYSFILVFFIIQHHKQTLRLISSKIMTCSPLHAQCQTQYRVHGRCFKNFLLSKFITDKRNFPEQKLKKQYYIMWM